MAKAILITGGTGSFGKKFVSTILARHPEVERLVVYSRDELKQSEMAQDFPVERYPGLRFFVGDVRDKDRLIRACEGIDVVVHAAALKQVPSCEYNPFEAIKTNVLGAENVIEAAIASGSVRKVVALSTDKAAAPINLYGATKLCSDKLFIAAQNFRGKKEILFSVVRYGNVMGSRGSVIPFFLKRRGGPIPITDERMTRFNITLEEGVELVLFALDNMWGGELFVPKIPSFRITDLAEAVAPGKKREIVGIRPGEKIHEEMITESDSPNTVEFDRYFAILPSMQNWHWDVSDFIKKFNGRPCPAGFSYNSGSNPKWLSVSDLRRLIKLHVDPSFSA